MREWYLAYISLHAISRLDEPDEEVARMNWHCFITRPGVGESMITDRVLCMIDMIRERLYVVPSNRIREIPTERMADLFVVTVMPVFESL